jgi:alkylation response protein AidB-like acyl-CoA dehydrogenase
VTTFLTDDDRALLLESVDALVRRHVAPRAAEIDATAAFPRDVYRAIGDLGLLAAFVPVEYGGADIGLMTTMLCVERIARSSAACALMVGNCGDGTAAIALGGSEEVKREVLPAIATGDAIPCFALTEAEAGSDSAALRATATRDATGYRLSGQKLYCTNGSVGDYFTVFARTRDETGETSISAFLVPRGAAGFEIGRDEDLLGMRGLPATVLTFDDVRVPLAWRLGEEGRGFALAMATLDEARLNISAVAMGLARAAFEAAVEHARTRRAFGKPIVEHQGLGFLLADMSIELAAAWTLLRRAIEALEGEHDRGASTVVAMAKVAATQAAMRVTTEAVQVLGGAGLTRELPVERMFRDAKACQILDGTTQVQQWIIARQLARRDAPFKEIGWN